VGFRWFVQNSARRWGVKGYVKNHGDGSVQILACGEAEILAQFTEAIRQGNGFSLVRGLEVEELQQNTEYEDFIIV